jgi:hypothetical protein
MKRLSTFSAASPRRRISTLSWGEALEVDEPYLRAAAC